MNDIEVIELLKSLDIYDKEQLDEWSNSVETYFSDNFCNILKQHEYDESLEIPDNVGVVTKFETHNYLPTTADVVKTIDEYVSDDSFRVYAYSYVFISSNSSIDEGDLIRIFEEKNLYKQNVHLIYTNRTIQECTEMYYENYDFPYDYFESDNMTKKIISHRLSRQE